MFRRDRDRFDRFTEHARNVLSLAQEEAQRMKVSYVGSEHLLLALLREGQGVAARVLQTLGMEFARAREVVAELSGQGEQRDLNQIGLTPEGKQVIQLAVDEARRLNHHYIGTEHLLLGLVRLEESRAVQVLRTVGIEVQAIRTQTMQVLSQRVVSDDPGEARAEAEFETRTPLALPYPGAEWPRVSRFAQPGHRKRAYSDRHAIPDC